jgi:anaerobic magnesium-protoporphyrin IX monomethyl ester cyclase
LYWVDDNFTNNSKRAIKLFQEMEKNKLKFNWVCDQRVDLVNNILLHEMKKAGCRTISFGIESANQRILDNLNKRITPQIAINATKKAKKVGIDFIMGTFVLGLPTESLGEIKNTLAFSRRLEIDYPQFHIFGAIPGTKIWDDLVKKGKIDPNKYWENGVKTLGPPLDEVNRLIRRAYFKFFTRPRYILGQIARTIKSKHRLKILYSNRHILSNSIAVRTFIDFSINTWTHGDYP